MEPLIRSIGNLTYWIGRRRVFGAIPPGGICAEIGVWKGDFSARILKELKPRELHLIDPWRFAPDFPKRWYGGALARNQADMDAIMESVRDRFKDAPAVRLHRGTSVEIAATFPDRYFDWLYIDGDHSASAVLADLTAWYPKLKPGGSVACDDYYWRDESRTRSVKVGIDAFLKTTETGPTRSIAGQFIITAPTAH